MSSRFRGKYSQSFAPNVALADTMAGSRRSDLHHRTPTGTMAVYRLLTSAPAGFFFFEMNPIHPARPGRALAARTAVERRSVSRVSNIR